MARVPQGGTAARKRRAPAKTTPATDTTVAKIPSAEIKRMIEAGWQPSEDGTLWFHQRKSRGEFLEFAAAVEREGQASAPVPDPVPEVDPDALGVDVASPAAVLPADQLPPPERNPLIYEDGAETGTGREVQRPPEPDAATFVQRQDTVPVPTSAYGGTSQPVLPTETPEQAALRADAEAREAAIERNEAPAEFAHDQVGDVSIWSCYHCNTQVRYAPHCLCPRCQAIRREANTTKRCPFCGNPSPHTGRDGV